MSRYLHSILWWDEHGDIHGHDLYTNEGVTKYQVLYHALKLRLPELEDEELELLVRRAGDSDTTVYRVFDVAEIAAHRDDQPYIGFPYWTKRAT